VTRELKRVIVSERNVGAVYGSWFADGCLRFIEPARARFSAVPSSRLARRRPVGGLSTALVRAVASSGVIRNGPFLYGT
jgi:hypothetical protein